jgi:hypothetical protein
LTPEEKIALLAAANWPRPIPVDADHMEMNWAIRTTERIDASVVDWSPSLQIGAETVLQESWTHVYKPDQIAEATPRVRVVFVDENHMVVRMTSKTKGIATGDPGMGAVISILQQLNNRVGIADLQGIPRRFWIFLQTKTDQPPQR